MPAAELTSIDPMPVGDGHMGWYGDLLVFLGPTFSNHSELSVLLYDVDGNERGSQQLPFTASIPAGQSRGHIASAAAALGDIFSGGVGITLHVAWIEQHCVTDDTSDAWEVLYYDKLDCIVSAST